MITRRDMLKRLAVLTGSVAFGVATHGSDEDWLISQENAAQLGLPCESDPRYPHAFCTYREGNLNVIIWHTKAFRDRWMEAHRHCQIERPRDRARRVRIFRHYLYGEML